MDVCVGTRGRTRKFVDLAEREDSEEVRGRSGTVPTIYEMQGAIAEAASRCGKKKGRFSARLPNIHPAQMDLEEAISLRSIESDYLVRFYLNRRVYRCRRK